MVSPNVDRVLQQVHSLSTDERQQLLDAIRERVAPPTSPSAEDLAAASLLRNGIIARIPPAATSVDVARHEAFIAVEVEGKPLSESLVEERR